MRAPAPVEISELLSLRAQGLPVIDVRSPAEHARGHLPGSRNLPALDDEERVEVGTLWKQKSPELALRRAEEIAATKVDALAREVRALDAPTVLLHCWRGGMRSRRVGEELIARGQEALVLEGGYKSFRRWVRDALATPREIRVLGGMTGSGKTEVLTALARLGETVIDLEALANHKGSAFGHLLEEPQPSNEHFENLLALAWAATDPERVVWLEDESRNIGRVSIPAEVFSRMESARVHVLRVPLFERVERIRRQYGSASREKLAACFERIRKRFGGLRTRQAVEHVARGELDEAIRIALAYYDKAYHHSLHASSQRSFAELTVAGASAEDVARRLLAEARATLSTASTS